MPPRRSLMDAFYRELFQGKDAATALRDAKLGLLRSADPDSVFKKPFYWAPFQLYAVRSRAIPHVRNKVVPGFRPAISRETISRLGALLSNEPLCLRTIGHGSQRQRNETGRPCFDFRGLACYTLH